MKNSRLTVDAQGMDAAWPRLFLAGLVNDSPAHRAQINKDLEEIQCPIIAGRKLSNKDIVFKFG